MDCPRDDPPAFGYNSDVAYRAQVYHVQTESLADCPEPTIDTLVYLRGTLLTRISNPGRGPSEDGLAPEALAERVRRQHQEVLKRVRRGEFAPRA